ncbi:spore protease YyaC [Clostridium sp. 'deep sea']|uniref:spore protease YyaC n=1 Tax=Clostridium sp. 'deep sea' TaxID=2779445 RepID=UPI0018968F4F|nr:spore protease YyaC [Clostridium sp. 'deep sea']QOR33986.1 spore protease YyaC [Clostridium sp. 'deep sea']
MSIDFNPQVIPITERLCAKYDDKYGCLYLAKVIKQIIKQATIVNKDIIVLCIGTDRSTGDALGPLIGSELQKVSLPKKVHVFGTLDQPVHAINLPSVKQTINDTFPNNFTIALDASLGNAKNVGVINVGYGSIRPGSGVNKQLAPVGDFYLTATVNIGGYMEYTVLQNTRLSLVVKIANTIAKMLEYALK